KTGIRIEESWPQFVTVSMVGGAIRRKLIHRESFRASVLNHSGNQTVLQSMAGEKCLLTTPSLLSKATQRRFSELRRATRGLALATALFLGHELFHSGGNLVMRGRLPAIYLCETRFHLA